MIVVRCPEVPQKGSQKRKTADFRKKSHLFEESLLQSFFVWKLSAAKLWGIHIGLTNRAKMIGGVDLF